MIVRKKKTKPIESFTTTCPSCGEKNLFDLASGDPPTTRCRYCDCAYTVDMDNAKPISYTEKVVYNPKG